MKRKIIYKSYIGLILFSLIIGFGATLLAETLKLITAFAEKEFLDISKKWPLFLLLFPTLGLVLIFLTRKFIFRGKKNKGIREIFQTIQFRKNELPAYKIPSHYINGFLTVIFGGSTGIEVSTVVATAAMGNSTYGKKGAANIYKTELICAGVAAGIATLFGSPIAGLLFAIEVISRKFNKTILISCSSSIFITWLYIHYFNSEKLFNFSVFYWKLKALPYMIFLSIIAGLMAVYFTKTVLYLKHISERIHSNFLRISIGAIIVGVAIYIFPQLYGDSYHAIPDLLNNIIQKPFSINLIFLLFLLVLLKPLIASITLGAGGDGGVFAPSIAAGSFLGMLLALGCNHYLGTELIIINFALIGGAAMLSASIHAPLTALFLTCSIVNEGFILFIPILIGTFIAKYTAKYICDYTVYTFHDRTQSQPF